MTKGFKKLLVLSSVICGILPFVQATAETFAQSGTRPAGYWKFDEGFGNEVNDSSGSEINGKITGRINWLGDDRRKYLLFNGTSTIVRMDASKLDFSTNESSLECWIYLSQPITAQRRSSQPFFSTPYGEFNAGKNNGRIYFRFPRYGVVSKTVFDAGKWYYLAGTFNRNEVKIYVNGKLEQTRPGGDYKPSSGEITFLSPVHFEDGIIADAKIYNRSLSAAEIEQHYQQEKNQFTNGFFKKKIVKIEDNFENNAVSKTWKTTPGLTAFSSEGAIQGKSSLKLSGKGLGSLYRGIALASKKSLSGKCSYRLAFDYKIIGGDRHLGGDGAFRVDLHPTFYKTPQDYYIGYKNEKGEFIDEAGRGTGNIRKKHGMQGHSSIFFSPSQADQVKVFFKIFGESSIIIDNLSFEMVKSGDTPPMPPDLYAPLPKSTISRQAVDFLWSGGGNAIKYEIQFSRNKDFKELPYNQVVEDTGYNRMHWLPDKLLPLTAGNWYWRVRGINEYGKIGAWSSIQWFQISDSEQMLTPLREISSSKPIFIFRPCVSMGQYRKICMSFPDTIKQYCALESSIYWSLAELLAVSPEKARKLMEAIDVPVYVVGAVSTRYNMLPLSTLEYIFQNFKNVEGVSVCEQSVWKPYVKNYHMQLYTLAARYGRHMNHCCMGHHFWLMFDREWRAAAAKYHEYILPALKYVSPSLEGYSILFGWKFIHPKGHFGTAGEAYYWHEGGFQGLNTPPTRVTDQKKCLVLRRQDKLLRLFPPTFWGMIMLTGLASGGDVFAFESTFTDRPGANDNSGFWSSNGKASASWERVVLPLIEDIIRYNLVPSTKAVRQQVKATCVIKENEIRRSRNIGWACSHWSPKLNDLMFGIYGVWYMFDMIPNESRYYFIPFITEDEKSKSASGVKLIDSGMFKSSNAVRSYLDRFYPDRKRGTAIIYSVGATNVVLNGHDNQDIPEDYLITLKHPAVKTMKGKVGVHQYLVGKVLDDGTLFMHVNNRAERNSIMEFACLEKPSLKVIPEFALINSSWNEKNKTMTVTVSHKEGAVRLFLK